MNANDRTMSYMQMAKAINEYPAKTEYKQAGLALLKKIFQNYAKPEWIDIEPERPKKNEVVKVKYSDGYETIAKYSGNCFIINDSNGRENFDIIQWKPIKTNKDLPEKK